MAKQKLTVNLTDEVLAILKELAEDGGRSMTEELRLAIADRKFFTDQIREGHSIQVVEGERSVRPYPVRILV